MYSDWIDKILLILPHKIGNLWDKKWLVEA